MKKRIAYIVIGLLLMIPAALSYAGGGLLSGFPSSTTAGDTVKFTPSLSEDESGSLKASVSPSSGAGLSVSGDTITVSFEKAGSYTISASAGDRSDSCSVTVKEAANSDSEDASEDSGGSSDDSSGQEESEGGSDAEDTDEDPQDSDDNGDRPDGKNSSKSEKGRGADGNALPGQGSRSGAPSGGASMASGGSASVLGGGTSDSGSKTTYAGSANNYLKSLAVEGFEFSQSFHKTLNSYFLTVNQDVDSIDVQAKAEDSDADVVITGTEDLSVGRNKVMVTVTAENGETRVYRIYVDVK